MKFIKEAIEIPSRKRSRKAECIHPVRESKPAKSRRVWGHLWSFDPDGEVAAVTSKDGTYLKRGQSFKYNGEIYFINGFDPDTDTVFVVEADRAADYPDGGGTDYAVEDIVATLKESQSLDEATDTKDRYVPRKHGSWLWSIIDNKTGILVRKPGLEAVTDVAYQDGKAVFVTFKSKEEAQEYIDTSLHQEKLAEAKKDGAWFSTSFKSKDLEDLPGFPEDVHWYTNRYGIEFKQSETSDKWIVSGAKSDIDRFVKDFDISIKLTEYMPPLPIAPTDISPDERYSVAGYQGKVAILDNKLDKYITKPGYEGKDVKYEDGKDAFLLFDSDKDAWSYIRSSLHQERLREHAEGSKIYRVTYVVDRDANIFSAVMIEADSEAEAEKTFTEVYPEAGEVIGVREQDALEVERNKKRGMSLIKEDLEEGEDNPAPPVAGEDSASASLINSLIRDEWTAIEQYNSAMINLKEYGVDPSIIEVLNHIMFDENTHVGNLQKVLTLLAPATDKIEKGTEQAEEILDTAGSQADDAAAEDGASTEQAGDKEQPAGE